MKHQTTFSFQNSKNVTSSFKILILTTLLAVSFSCQNSIEERKYTASQFDIFGQLHNQGLEVVFGRLKEVRDSSNGKMSLSEVLSVTQKASLKFLMDGSPELTKEQQELINTKFSTLSNHFNEAIANTKTSSGRIEASDLTTIIMAEVAPHLSSNQNLRINEIFNALSTNSGDLNGTLNSLKEIENKVYTLPVDEQPVVLEALAIAKNSSTYWTQNGSAWEQELSGLGTSGSKVQPNTNGRITKMSDASIVAGVDVGSGILMGIACAIEGPVGWGFAIKAVSGAAVLGSAAMGGLLAWANS